MKLSVAELIEVVYHYYPRSISGEGLDSTRTDENQRLIIARRNAGVECSRWLGMLQRLRARFPEQGVSNLSVHLVTGSCDACYSGSLALPAATDEHWRTMEFRVSFLVPYYIIYGSCVIDDLEEMEKRRALRETSPRTAAVFVHDTMHVLPASVVKPEFLDPPSSLTPRRRDIRFDYSPEEQPYAAGLVHEIEATWGYSRMPPEVGRVIVPDVMTDQRRLGEATLYDCLFSDDW